MDDFTYEFRWEEDELGGDMRLHCSCGETITQEVVNIYREILCPKCGTRYKGCWYGFVIRKLADNEYVTPDGGIEVKED